MGGMNDTLPQTAICPSDAAKEYGAYIAELHLPRYHELPDIDLYMDQVLTYVENHLRPLVPADEKLLTASMVNNYVKQGIVPTPKAKRYTRDHIAYLIAICLMKRTFSMNHILRMIGVQIETHGVARAYDFFCSVTEESLRMLFCGTTETRSIGTWRIEQPHGYAFSLDIVDSGDLSPERRLVISAATCAANRIFVEKSFELADSPGAFAPRNAPKAGSQQ